MLNKVARTTLCGLLAAMAAFAQPQQVVKLTASDAETLDNYALTVPLSGDTAGLLSAPYDDAVAIWTFDDGSGFTATDATGLGNDGILNNFGTTPNWTTGKIGGALRFDGIDDFVQVSTPVVPTGGQSRTIAGWINIDPHSTAMSYLTYGQRVPWELVAMTVESDGKLTMASHTDDLNSNVSIAAGSWSFFSMTFDGTTVDLYLNNVVIGSKAIALNTTLYDAGLLLGAHLQGPGDFNFFWLFGGMIDEVAIWDRKLSSAEIDALWNGGDGLPGDTGPLLTIPTAIPAAKGETVDVDIDFTNDGLAIAATAFSVDYDQSCLDFDDTDADPVDGIPDAIDVQVPADFSVTIFHDLGDDDGEIDVSIVDFSPPISTLADGTQLSVTFTAACSPALGETITAPVVFSTDPQASFSDDLAQDVEGDTSDGSVVIYPGPRGDCNGNGIVTAADLVALGLEIFDGDGSFWVDVPGGTFLGSPVGCDANADTEVNAGDVSCTILLIFGGTCGGGGSRQALRPPAVLRIDGTPRFQPEKRLRIPALRIPVRFESHGHLVSSLAFSLDLEPFLLHFDPADRDRDGVPDAVRFPVQAPSLTDVRFSSRDRDGELDVLLSLEPGATFEDGVLLEIEVEPVRRGRVGKALRFSSAPAASFGNLHGESVPGRTVVDREEKLHR